MEEITQTRSGQLDTGTTMVAAMGRTKTSPLNDYLKARVISGGEYGFNVNIDGLNALFLGETPAKAGCITATGAIL